MEDKTPPNDPPALDLQDIRQIVDLMSKNDLSFFHLEHGGFKIKLRRGSDMEAVGNILSKMSFGQAQQSVGGVAPVGTYQPPASAATAPAAIAAAAEPPAPPAVTINSPMVGTFYRSPGPNEKIFVNVGDSVDENTVVCIIEAMKVMNEIKAEARGVISKVLIDDAKPVQYGQPLYELK